jgi:hypothetical protein
LNEVSLIGLKTSEDCDDEKAVSDQMEKDRQSELVDSLDVEIEERCVSTMSCKVLLELFDQIWSKDEDAS